MSLIKSISGIRGTIGGKQEENLTPIDVVKFASAFCQLLQKSTAKKLKIVVGRDARTSGETVSQLVCSTLVSMGADVSDVGLSTTPTVEMEVVRTHADGGIIITASHNPTHWNALKLLNNQGEFLSARDGEMVIDLSQKAEFEFATHREMGTYTVVNDAIEQHIQKILALDLVDCAAIKAVRFKVGVDCINSTGGIALPRLLQSLGVEDIRVLNGVPDGDFAHNPEPLPENITQICRMVKENKLDIGFVVDPDVDRLAIVCENGEPFGEEYTLVAVADYILRHRPKGNTVSNLSSTQALKIVTQNHGGQYNAAAVGEVNVVEMMKQTQAVIGGEGNGGVIFPELHYGRDALVGIALLLTHLAKCQKTTSQLRADYPNFYISKNKLELDGQNVDEILSDVKQKYIHRPHTDIDGIRIEFDNQWVQLRKSNTEPIIRIYAESFTEQEATRLAQTIMNDINELTNKK